MSVSVSVLITNFNTWKLAERCARSAAKKSGDDLDKILIVDDHSDTEKPNNLPSLVEVIRNEENQGYVKSVNIGFSKLNSDLVVLFDSDAEPLMDFVPQLKKAFEKTSSLGALAFHLVDRKDNPTGVISPQPSVFHYILGKKLGSKLKLKNNAENMCIHSCGMAVRRTAFESINGFDEDFDFLDADIDFSMRLHNEGWRLAKSDLIVAYHEGGGSPQKMRKRVYRHHQNRWKLLEKHDKLRYPKLTKCALASRHAIEYALLRTIGAVITKSPEELEDKILGRRALLKGVWSRYSETKAIKL